MKIHLKKVLVSLLVIVGFVFYAVYQRYFIAQQAIVNNAPPDTAANGNTPETVTTTTVSQAETVPPANTIETLAVNGNGDDNEYGNDNEDGGGSVSQQTTQSASGQTNAGGTSTTTAANAGSTNSTTAASTSTATGSASITSATTTTAANALYKDGQYDGNVADAYYGLVQVRAIIQGGKLTDVVFLSYPNDRSESIKINTYATPILKAEAIKAQSAKVNAVTGATNTSRAFINSLTSALNQAQV
jgi:uncharacterized protein with FMN-binding domain